MENLKEVTIFDALENELNIEFNVFEEKFNSWLEGIGMKKQDVDTTDVISFSYDLMRDYFPEIDYDSIWVKFKTFPFPILK